MSIPSFQNGCIAPASTGSNVYLAGTTISGSLSIYTINLSNPNSPTATLLGNNADTAWSQNAKKACIAFPGLAGVTNAPFLVQQFGVGLSQQLNVYPNGTLWGPFSFASTSFISPQQYSIVGASKDFVWLTAATNKTYTSGTPWVGVRLNATDPFNTISDPVLTNYPSSTPLVSVGTYIPTQNTPAQGYSIVFDLIGGGNIFSSLNTAVLLQGADRVISLSTGTPVSMDGIKLTNNVIPVTMVGTAYLIDQAKDGTVVLYSINPSQGNQLKRVDVPGNAPLFAPGMVATAMGQQIVIYGSSSGTATAPFNVYDTLASTWSGPGLVKPAPIAPPTSATPSPYPTAPQINPEPKKTNIGAIVGGVVGGLALIALIAFFVIRNRRKNRELETGPDGPSPPNMKETPVPIAPPFSMPPQPQPQPQGFDPRASYYPQPAQSPPQFHAQAGFDAQKPYTYAPPIFDPNTPQHPTIFQPANSSSPSQSQNMYSPTPTAAVSYSPAASQTFASNPPSTPHFNGYA
ncbi:hypothetical protein FBU30_002934 [Linnemannia zychae]|nr:hypothetical protein FBU30_002934 [Linnemannia zychae]